MGFKPKTLSQQQQALLMAEIEAALSARPTPSLWARIVGRVRQALGL
jgi:hypothetical protein